MHKFRVKPSTSLPTRRSKTPEQNSEDPFPFNNKKLRVSGWEDEAVTIKRFKSHVQISRKNYEFIPNLKTLQLNNEKVSIVKSAKNQYNIFVRKQNGKKLSGLECVNGIRNDYQRDGQLFCNSKLVGINRMGAHRNTLIYNRSDRTADFTTSLSKTTPLLISGQPKCLSPSRGGVRVKNVHGDEKIIIL